MPLLRGAARDRQLSVLLCVDLRQRRVLYPLRRAPLARRGGRRERGLPRLPDDDAAALNALDNDAVAAVVAGDEDSFHEAFEQMIDLVRRAGTPLGEDELEESDVILPPPDTTLEEAAHEFTGDGLIPD